MWIIGIAVAAVILFQFAKIAVFHFNGTSFTHVSQQSQNFSPQGFHKGGFGQFDGSSRHMMGGHHGFANASGVQVNWFFTMLIELGLIGFGWVLWKLGSKNKLQKAIGGALLFIGVWALLPNWLVLFALIAGAYYWYRIRKNSENPTDFTGGSYQDFAMAPSKNLDFLDEWERTIKKEDN